MLSGNRKKRNEQSSIRNGENQQKLFDRHNHERKRQKETIWESSQLITLITQLGCLLDDNFNDYQSFLSEKDFEIFALQNSVVELNQNLVISEENLQTVRNSHFSAKVKYISLLAIETSRNFLPTKVGSLITGLETLIFSSQLTGFTPGYSFLSYKLSTLIVSLS